MVISTRVPENIEKGKYPDAYVFSPKKGIVSRRPVTGLDFASLYSSIIMAHNLFSEKFIFDPKDIDIKDLYPAVLEDLFNKRLDLKALLAPLGKKKQHLGKMISSAKESGKMIPERLNLEYSSVCFDYDHWNSKQKALKKGFRIKYENTDSLYLTCSDSYYEKCDEAFSREELSKEVYWTEMVKIIMDMMRKLCD
ncbi:3700_t:CDS:2 [Funneliformis geosporum]|uniref:DNA-directed DNA polymerase n=1 Tax=Funneliformis geosporum TaxID=1117311 RepID=A0A9W4WSI6_9GLOM|nr:3700_t:CDS:2 [Funneliformis geosporum]